MSKADNPKAVAGDNSDAVYKFTAGQLKSYIERIEKLEDEKALIASDVKDIYGEARGQGYDVKALRTLIGLRKKDADQRQEEATILHTYMKAVGMDVFS